MNLQCVHVTVLLFYYSAFKYSYSHNSNITTSVNKQTNMNAYITLRQLNADLIKAYEHINYLKQEISRLEKVVTKTDGWTRVKPNRNPRLPIHPPVAHTQNVQTQNRFSPLNSLSEFPPLPQEKGQKARVYNRPTHVRVAKPKQNSIKHHSNTPKKDNTLSQKQKIILLADSHGRNLSSHLREILPSKYSITGIFKPNARMADVIEELDSHTKELTHRDTVVVIGGQNDINLGGSFIPSQHLPNLVKATCHTNVILTTLPPRHNHYTLNKHIKIANNALKHHLRDTQIKLLDLDCLSAHLFTRHGLHLNRAGKQSLASRLASLILKSHVPSTSSPPPTPPPPPTLPIQSSTPTLLNLPSTPLTLHVPSTSTSSPPPTPPPTLPIQSSTPTLPKLLSTPLTHSSQTSPALTTSSSLFIFSANQHSSPPISYTAPRQYNLRHAPKQTKPLNL